jgi:hypothetical protein
MPALEGLKKLSKIVRFSIIVGLFPKWRNFNQYGRTLVIRGQSQCIGTLRTG